MVRRLQRFACAGLLLAAGAMPVRADKMVLRDGTGIFGTITSEKDSLIKYFDRYERPRKIASSLVDTIEYDSKAVDGLVKVAFRKGQPSDRSGFFHVRYADELDLDVEYHTDSLSELDLFFKNNVHVRVLPSTNFRIGKAPKGPGKPLVFHLLRGRVLVTSPAAEALARILTPWGVGVGRGRFQFGMTATAKDSSVQVTCLHGLTGVQENIDSPGELVVDEGKSVQLVKREGVFNRGDPDLEEGTRMAALAANMGHYVFSEIEYPPIGYLAKAITGLGFMVFFYGSAVGILDYVNHI